MAPPAPHGVKRWCRGLRPHGATSGERGREREGEGERKEGKPGAEAVEAAFRDREERRRARERKRRRDIFRRIQKEKQKLLFIFGRPDSEQTQ